VNRRGRTLDTGGAAVFVSMRITVNGREMEVADGLSVEALLTHLAVKREYTAVAVNREITPKSAYATVALREGDRVEIVRPMGGGAR
jgi:thiamine biosynthesis protein ThiS